MHWRDPENWALLFIVAVFCIVLAIIVGWAIAKENAFYENLTPEDHAHIEAMREQLREAPDRSLLQMRGEGRGLWLLDYNSGDVLFTRKRVTQYKSSEYPLHYDSFCYNVVEIIPPDDHRYSQMAQEFLLQQ